MQLLKDVVLPADNALLHVDLTGVPINEWDVFRFVTRLQCNNGVYARSMMRFNDDAARNYLWFVRNEDGSNVNSADTVTYAAGFEAAHASGPDNGNPAYWGENHVDLFDLSKTDRYKHYQLVGGTMPHLALSKALGTIGGGTWKNNAAVNKISLFANEAAWKAGSRATLYGVIPAGTPALVAPDGTPPLTVAVDSFDRPDAADLGLMWTDGALGGRHRIVGNACKYALASSTSGDFYRGVTFHSNQYSKGVVAAGGWPGTDWVGVTVRNSGSGHAYLFIVIGTTASIYRIDPGPSYTLKQSQSIAGALVANDVMELRAVGNALTGKINGVTVVSSTDSNFTLGWPGIATFVTGADPATFSSWEGGEL